MSQRNQTAWLPVYSKTGLPLHHSDSKGNYFCAHRGTSMNPTLSRQELLEITGYDVKKPEIGDVAFFLPPHEKDYCVHRIIKKGPEGFFTRGDNNSDIDAWVLQEEDIYGRVIAAHQGQRSRKIYGGLPGRLAGISCLARRKTNALIVTLLGPVYRAVCNGGLLHRLIPLRLKPQVATFQSNKNTSHKLLLGKQVIGSYDYALLKWQIKRPYRIFINESSLPKPR